LVDRFLGDDGRADPADGAGGREAVDVFIAVDAEFDGPAADTAYSAGAESVRGGSANG
jgi:hypothetical protein